VRRRYPLKTFFRLNLFLIDACAFVLAYQAAYATRFHSTWFLSHFPAIKGIPNVHIYNQALAILLPAWLFVFLYIGFYKEPLQNAYDEIIRIVKGVLLGALLSTAMSFAYRSTEYSRLVILLWSTYSVVFIFTLHEVVKALYKRMARRIEGPNNTLVVGHGNAMKVIREAARKDPFMRTTYMEQSPNAEELDRMFRQRHITNVVLLQGPLSSSRILEISRICEAHDIDCQIIPDLLEMRRGEIIFNGFCGLPTFHIQSLSLHGSNYVLKRGFDLIVSAAVLVLFAIPLLVISVLIKFDNPGPVLYTQDRMGWRGRKFKLYKFRTMGIDADIRLKSLKHLSDRSGPVFKMKNDPRITHVGKWLRKFSIDELPQIFNVILGDMSLVGPRPQVLWEAEAYDEYAKKRLRVMPGITGLWQVSGRASLSYEEMINLDVYYLENWSLGLDLKILLRTLPAVFAKDGAY
jgi:exopolysaccharide biosynthesis polyprenyl glycosylphosphotransferase